MDRIHRRRAVGLTVSLMFALVAPAATAARPPDGAADTERVRAIVTFDHRPDRASERAVERLEGNVGRHLNLINGLSIDLPRGQLKQLEKAGGVKHVELDHKITAFDHAGSTGDLEYENAWGVEHIGTRPVHLAGNTGQGIKLAVIDTGLDDMPMIRFTPSTTAVYWIEPTMHACSREPCGYGIAIFRK